MASEIAVRIIDRERNIVEFVGQGAPSAALTAGLSSSYLDPVSGARYTFTLTGWVQTANAGDAAPPAGTAGGDLIGTYPSPLVAKLYGNPVSNASPAANTFLKFLSSAWQGALLLLSDLPGQITTTRKLLVSAGNGTTAGTPFYDTLGASDIPSIPASRLSATGTQDATTFLRGDNTWAAVSGAALPVATIVAQLDNGATVLDGTIFVEGRVHATGNITEASLVSKVAGSVSIDVYHATYANYPTFTKISASAPLAIVNGYKYDDTTLTGWTVAVADGDFIRLVVTSATTITRATAALKIQRTA